MTAGVMTPDQELLRDFDALRGKMQEVLQSARHDVRVAKREAEKAESEAEEAEGRADEAEEEARAAEYYFDQYASLAGSLQRHVWRDDKPGATYCVGCGDTWPIHRHDCPFGAVE